MARYVPPRSVKTDVVLAKLARPALHGIYARARLFRLLDQARDHPIVWISAPGGSGKTTLVASYLHARRIPGLWYQIDAGDNDVGSFIYYMGIAARTIAPRQRALPLLTPEYLRGLPVFVSNYFRDLYARLKPPSIVVFDNLQEAGEGTIRDVLLRGFEQIPAGIGVIVISREDPPSPFAALRTSGKMAVIGWDELKLTETESEAIVKLRRHHPPSRTVLTTLFEQTRGWVAGLVLLTEQTDAETQEEPYPGDFDSQSIFDYFANEILRRTDAPTREFLLKTSFLTKVSVSVAKALTDEKNSDDILRDLTRRNYFTVKLAEDSYEYHPLFRVFLASRAATTFTAEQVKALKQRSAELLAASGDVDAAIVLLQEAENWQEALRLLHEHAPLLRTQGRLRTLEAWIDGFPESMRAQNPSVHYWLGVCRLSFAPRDARQHFERAFAFFETQRDSSLLYLAWAGIVESFLLEWNDFTPLRHWLERYPYLAADRNPPKAEIENASLFTYLAGLLNGNADHPDLIPYIERAEQLLERESNQERLLSQTNVLLLYYFWSGNVARVDDLRERLARYANKVDARPLARLTWYRWVAGYSGMTGESEESFRATTEGLALAQSSGVHLLDVQLLTYGIWGQIAVGNVTAARTLLQQMSRFTGSGQSGAFYSRCASMLYLHEGEMLRALEEGRRSVALAKTNGWLIGVASALFGFAYASAATGNTQEALTAMAEARGIGERMRSNVITFFCAFAEANIYRMRAETELSIAALREALVLGREMKMVTPASCPRADAAALYSVAIQADICVDYVRGVIGKTRLPPPKAASEHWPWPIRLCAFGEFTVLKDDAPLAFTGRVHKKPLELLRAIVVFGGRDVSIEKLAQTLWPEREGDMAVHSLETTLYRLRKLLGDRAIVMQESQLSLNPDYCWLDVWAFEHAYQPADISPPSAERARRLLTLYRGSFLQGDDAPVVVLQRERLRSKFVRIVEQFGQVLESESRYEAAIPWYQKGIEVEPLGEGLYRRLMICYLHLHRTAEAIATYQRCQTVLTATLHIEPTAETKALYAQIQRHSAS